MAELRFFRRSKFNYAPAAYGSTETIEVMDVAVGGVVGAAFGYVRVVDNGQNGDGTQSLGDDGSVARFMTTANVGIRTLGLKRGTGAGLTETLGYLYTTANTIDVVYTVDTGTAPTTGNVDYWIYVAKVSP